LPNAINGYLYRGLCRNDQASFAGAEEDFTAALALNPSVPTTRINRALAYYNLANFDAAERDATAAIDAGLKDPRAFFVRALIRDAQSRHAEAKADRERGFALPPTDDKGWVARGAAALREDPERAAREFSQGAQAFPNSKALLQNLVHVYGDRLGKVDDAIGYAQMLVDLNSNDPSALAGLAVLCARKGDGKTALQYANRAGQNHPAAVTSLQIACAYALVSKINPEEVEHAIDHLRQALASDPKLGQRAASDPDFASLQSVPEFKAILAAANQLTESKPTTTSPAPPAESKKSKQESRPEKTQQAS
jgi:tetratricopeptide (TPR) repeat protein